MKIFFKVVFCLFSAQLIVGCHGQFKLMDMALTDSGLGKKTFLISTAGDVIRTKGSDVVIEISAAEVPNEMSFFNNDSCAGAANWEPFSSAKTVPLNAPDGMKTFSVLLRYLVNGSVVESDCQSLSVELDQTAPVGAEIEKVGGNSPTNNPIVTLNPSGLDNSLPIEYFISDDSSCAAGTWHTGIVPLVYTLPGASSNFDGNKIVYYKFRDGLGNSTGCLSYSIHLDTISPEVTVGSSVTAINVSTGTNILIQGNCSENGVGAVRISANSNNGGSFSPETADCILGDWSKTINLSTLNQGTITINATQVDLAGNSGDGQLSLLMDITPPVIEFSDPSSMAAIGIVNRAAFLISGLCSEDGTNNISIEAMSTGGGIYVPTNASCVGGIFSHSLDLSSLNDGTVSVTIRLSDSIGNSGQAVRSFVLDSVAPTLTSILINSGSIYTTTSNVSLAITGSGSPVEFYATETAGCASNGSWTSLGAPNYLLSAGQGSKTIYAKVRDAAGNESGCQSDSILVDTMAPNGTLQINSGQLEATSTSVVLSLSADADVAQMYLFEGTCPGGIPSFSGYQSESNLILSEFANKSVVSEVRYVSAILKDLAGNENCITDSDGILLWNTRNFISFRGPGYRVLDTAGVVSVPVYLRDYAGTGAQLSQSDIDIEYSLFDGSTVSKGTITLAAGNSQQDISIPIPDVSVEKILKLNLNFPNQKYAVLHSLNQMSISVVDASAVNLPIGVVSSNGDHTCLIKGANALSASNSYGKLYCWGDGDSRQIDGVKLTRLSPVPVDSGNDYKDVSAGGLHTCGILTDGNMNCWGANESGQLGKGGAVDPTPPAGLHSVTHPGSLTWVAVSSGSAHTCAIDSSAKLYCWGSDSSGQLGNGSTSGVQTSPVEVDSALVSNSWVQVSAGYNHTCAINSNKFVYCWGANDSGQTNPLLVGSNSESPVKVTLAGANAGLNPDIKVSVTNRLWDRERRVGAGGNHSCAITSHLSGDNTDSADRSRLYCWGKNDYQQSGDVETNLIVSPARKVATTSYWSVSLGDDNTCAITYNAALTSRAMRCFGSTDYGKLGNGATTYSDVFAVDRDVKNTTTSLVSYNAVALGKDHTCGVSVQTRRDAEDPSPLSQFGVRCAGISRAGQLGTGESSRVTTPTVIDNFTMGTGGARAFGAISVGPQSACAIGVTGELYCWGSASKKLIGDGVTSLSGGPHGFQRSGPTLVEAGTDFSKVDVGFEQACAITTAGRLKCWGENSDGHIGVGNADLATPVDINPSVVYTEVSSGGSHVCAITTGNALHCFGFNSSGQIGDGTNLNRKLPVVVDSGTSYLKVDAGASHTCGITSGFKLKCWGLNTDGQLGLGDTVSRNSPVLVDGANDYLDVSVGVEHTCAIRKVTSTEGTLVCWGRNQSGQLGNNTSGTDVLLPSPTVDSAGSPIGDHFSKVSVGDATSCAIRSDYKMLCWGYNSSGQIGDGTTVGRVNPTVNYINAASAIGMGSESACALEIAGGQLKCWGDDERGTVGARQKTLFFQFVPGL